MKSDVNATRDSNLQPEGSSLLHYCAFSPCRTVATHMMPIRSFHSIACTVWYSGNAAGLYSRILSLNLCRLSTILNRIFRHFTQFVQMEDCASCRPGPAPFKFLYSHHSLYSSLLTAHCVINVVEHCC